MPNISVHEEKVVDLLGQFQTLELSLALYIAAAHMIAKSLLAGTLAYRYSYRDVDKYPLGKLVAVFQKLNDNEPLHTKLNEVIKHRNDVAHRTLVHNNPVVADLLGIDLDKLTDSLDSIAARVNECLLLLAPELQAVLAKANDTKPA
jgi:hypothetical protein